MAVDREGLGGLPYVLIKRGLYWRPNAQGYTGLLSEAGHYSEEDATAYHGHDAGSTTFMLASEAPEFAPECWNETKLAVLSKGRAAAQADVARLSAVVEALKAALRPFAEYARLSEEAGLDIGDGEIGEFIHRGFRRSIRTQDLRAARTALSRADKADSRERGEP